MYSRKNKIIFVFVFLIIVIFGFLSFYQINKKDKIVPDVNLAGLSLSNSDSNNQWTDENENEDLIIASDKKTYFGVNKSDIYFSIENKSSQDQNIALRFLFSDKNAKLESVERIAEDGEQEIPKANVKNFVSKKQIPNSFVSSDFFGEPIKSGETLHYHAVIKYQPNSKGEFYIEAFGDSGAYGLLDPWYDSSGLVGYWSFNGGDVDWNTNIVTDGSGNGNNGSMVNMTASENPLVGVSGQALDFNGSNEYISIADSSSLDVSTQVSISVWIKPDTVVTAERNIIAKNYIDSTNGQHAYGLAVNSAGIVYGWVDGDGSWGGGDLVTAGENYSNLSVNEWHHIVMTYNGSVLRFYRDGINTAVSSVNSITIHNSTQPLFIAHKSDWSNYFDGKIDEVLVYNRALSTDEITTLYNLGNRHTKPSPQNNDGLVGYWTMDSDDLEWGQTSAEVRDHSGNGNNGDAVSMTSANSVTGKYGQALDFDGANDYVMDSSINFTTPDSFGLWFKPDNTITSASSCQGILTLRYGGVVTDYFHVGLGSCAGDVTDEAVTILHDASGRTSVTSVSFTANTWYRMDFVWGGSYYDIYINGVQQTVTKGGAISHAARLTDAERIEIGAEYDASPNLFFNGKIDDVRIYNRTISAIEIANLYNNGAKKFKINTAGTGKTIIK